MKNIAAAIMILMGPNVALANCHALDYQEMKEMKATDLAKEYCKVKAKTAAYIVDSRSESKYANELRELDSLSRSREREDDASDALSKAVRLQNSADQCREQEVRIERVLAVNGVSMLEVKAMCEK
jgi:hypothetical protein